MDEFIFPLLGGVVIGLSASLLLLANGRIAGIAGIVRGAFFDRGEGEGEGAWRWLFLGGLVLGPVLVHTLTGVPVPAPSSSPWWLIVLAGLVVGYGTRLGCGCTSGHGVCGLGRLSARSLVATITFMATGILTVFIVRHVIGGVL